MCNLTVCTLLLHEKRRVSDQNFKTTHYRPQITVDYATIERNVHLAKRPTTLALLHRLNIPCAKITSLQLTLDLTYATMQPRTLSKLTSFLYLSNGGASVLNVQCIKH